MDLPGAERATYILPIRAAHGRAASDLAAYLRALDIAQIIVVDGSPADVFELHRRAFPRNVEHVRPLAGMSGKNGKARGVLSGLACAKYDRVIVADDDVRYDADAIRSVLGILDRADVVRPQNYFSPLPWHAALDSARILINRALDGDWPGTLAFRASLLPFGYNADVLFENLELVRTIRANGGREALARDVFVRRIPPTAAHFFSQRVRQAYDEFARLPRLLAALAIVPFAILAFALHRRDWLAALAAASIALATIGLLRGAAYRYIPCYCALLAPAWLAERGVCAWLAVYERARFGGVRYSGGVLSRAASSPAELRKRWAI